jgi:hypothetical protein
MAEAAHSSYQDGKRAMRSLCQAIVQAKALDLTFRFQAAHSIRKAGAGLTRHVKGQIDERVREAPVSLVGWTRR